jgi:hypothetical protein
VIDPRFAHRAVRDPAVCGAEPIIRGTRVTLRVIIASLAEGDSPERNCRGVSLALHGRRPRGHCLRYGIVGRGAPAQMKF